MIKKKLIEVAMPIEAINKASVREKSIRHGHPSTFHLYWARRPLAACRAVLFAQIVDDPSNFPEKFPSIEDQKKERNRLFKIIEDLVQWENSQNKNILKQAQAEIDKSCEGKSPKIYDPFSGGGTIPLEAQRLGLEAFGSDLNPVATIISKGLIEIPPLFRNMEPIHPGILDKFNYRNAEGLAEDVKYYGKRVLEKLSMKIGSYYPEIEITSKHGKEKCTVISWIWARTIPSPDPAFQNTHVPLVSTFMLSSKKGKEILIKPNVDKINKSLEFLVSYNNNTEEINNAKLGTKLGRGANFKCLFSNSIITPEYVRKMSNNKALKYKLLCIIAEGKNGRVYQRADEHHEKIALTATPSWVPDIPMNKKSKDLVSGRGYGFDKWYEIFTNRQLLALTTISDVINDISSEVSIDFDKKNQNCIDKQKDKKKNNYLKAITLYLTFCLSRFANRASTINIWDPNRETIAQTFGRQAIPMTWDFAECNPFCNSTGNWLGGGVSWVAAVLENLTFEKQGFIYQKNAMDGDFPDNSVFSTDPPYYDNIAYADLSDYFYIWLKPNLKKYYNDIFSSILTPKSEELVALQHRHETKFDAEMFFLNGMTKTFSMMAKKSNDEFPTTIYYAYKQSEKNADGVSSTGWATFLEALIQAGYSIVGTWPMRLERPTGLKVGKNALATAIVLVCRKREEALGTITRSEFVRQLKTELPKAIADLKAANISPADIPQSSIGPGMAIFSRYTAVLENDDTHMSVKTGLQLINRELGDEEGEYDSETSFAITWFEQNGFDVGDFGSANNIANAKGISVNTLVHSGIAQSSGGKFNLLNRESLEDDWDPKTDKSLTIWECCQHLIKTMENKGEFETAKLMKQMGSGRADSAKELAYTLYNISADKRKDANEATAYNGLIAVWSELTAQAANITEEDLRGDAQMRMI